MIHKLTCDIYEVRFSSLKTDKFENNKKWHRHDKAHPKKDPCERFDDRFYDLSTITLEY